MVMGRDPNMTGSLSTVDEGVMPLSLAVSFCIVPPSHAPWFAAIRGEHGWHSTCSLQGWAL